MMTRKGFCFIILCCLAGSVQAQYFYHDIYQTRLTNEEHAAYTKYNIRRVNITSYDAYHTVNKDFVCKKELSENNKQVITNTASPGTGSSTLRSEFDDSGRIINTIDSTSISINRTHYYYNPNYPNSPDSLIFVSSAIKDKDTFLLKETHIYYYDGNGIPIRMIREKNGLPFSEVTFKTDSSGRVIKESEEGKNETPPPVYYKYNATGKLTDIFHYNKHRQKMQPDFLFDYDARGRLLEKTTVIMNTGDYLLWKYFYNEQGLISKEVCYGKKQALQGSLEFTYSY